MWKCPRCHDWEANPKMSISWWRKKLQHLLPHEQRSQLVFQEPLQGVSSGFPSVWVFPTWTSLVPRATGRVCAALLAAPGEEAGRSAGQLIVFLFWRRAEPSDPFLRAVCKFQGRAKWWKGCSLQHLPSVSKQEGREMLVSGVNSNL